MRKNNAQKVLNAVEKRIADIEMQYRKRYNISDVYEELSIFDWWNEYLSKTQLMDMRKFLKEAIKLGYTGYVCFKVGAAGCSNGMWAHKEETAGGYSPEGECLYKSFVSSYNYWSVKTADGKWLPMDDDEANYDDVKTIKELEALIKSLEEIKEEEAMEEYAKEVSTIVAEKLGKETEVTNVDKPNAPNLVGVCIKEGAHGANYYINEDFEAGVDAELCAKGIIANYETVIFPDILGEDEIDMSWNKIKDNVTVRLVGIDRNMDYLRNVVCRPVGHGLALIADINISDTFRCPATNVLAEDNDYDVNELMNAALLNSSMRHPASLQSLEGTLFGDAENIIDKEDVENKTMCVLTNDTTNEGACVLFYPGVAEKVRKAVGDYYALPSSIHEFIIVPKSEWSGSTDELIGMVVTANNSVVDAKDVLSDSVLFYDGAFTEVA